ncbi:MAG: hypothetical protein KA795_03375 [Burkholderiaceae bacterium]|nr:hypothetical protein [Burkholderiaceae bacterium]
MFSNLIKGAGLGSTALPFLGTLGGSKFQSLANNYYDIYGSGQAGMNNLQSGANAAANSAATRQASWDAANQNVQANQDATKQTTMVNISKMFLSALTTIGKTLIDALKAMERG